MSKAKPLHFIAAGDIDWEKTARLKPRKDGRFTGVVELTPARRKARAEPSESRKDSK